MLFFIYGLWWPIWSLQTFFIDQPKWSTNQRSAYDIIWSQAHVSMSPIDDINMWITTVIKVIHEEMKQQTIIERKRTWNIWWKGYGFDVLWKCFWMRWLRRRQPNCHQSSDILDQSAAKLFGVKWSQFN